ncbi:TonB-dependent receptor plug domain-containing protein [Sphingobium lignivorans]|uniref:Outer membrane receptor protein involved in Fe transport n=1 Tax=Sphingobium lignivorans TaxID=2735886 RepID=A0ABR6NBP2_9SPHN|nr:TonB-dependent receptor [Sphingobium lignivorans]MBB5984659.1 outer membrane receptor protein involved in Fe transport [Sphingobium lignivorans]
MRRELRALLLTGTMSAGAIFAGPALAQEPQEAQADTAGQNEAIVITGSRIARRDYSANSPIVTVGAELLETSTSAAIETSLNKLPQFTPAQTPALGGDIQATATNTPGAASVSLRGLGANRNLVLLDGRRATPGNANMVVDINSIPSAAIERVEIITGGASATYGADAVGGVVNFILKKNFQGLQLDGRMGISQRGDGQEYTINGIMGTDFADGRGNISIAMETNDRSSSKRVDRKWFRDFYSDPDTVGNQNFSDYPSYIPGVNRPSQAVMNSIFSGRNVAQFPNYPTTGTLWFNTNGTVFGGINNFATRAGAYRYAGAYGPGFKENSLGFLGENFLEDQLVLPLNRFNLYARGNFEITDWVSLTAQGYFNKTSTRTIQQRAGAVNGWSANIPITHEVPAELRAILASRTPAPGTSAQALANLNCPEASPLVPGSAANCDWQLNQYPLDVPRSVNADVYTYQMLVALEGRVPGTDWTWDISGSQGESETSFLSSGFVSLERYRTVITAPNWGAGFSAQGNQSQGGFGASRATCTSGLNPFDNIATSQDCLDAISADVKSRSVMQQTNWEANAQGSLVALPAGDLRAAVGASYRRNRFTFTNDTLSTQGQSFLDQVAGLYPSGNSKGSITVKELYGELLVPLLSDLPLIRKLELELGARTSDYDTTGNAFTWKAMADWEVTDWLRVRGGYNRAVRAPNIAELFQAPQQSFVSLNRGDACSSTNNLLAYGAGPANTTNRAAVRALCETLMNGIDPTTADQFYSGTQVSGATTGFATSTGNLDIKPEIAKTWTVGAVIASPVQSPWLSGMRLSVDYYNIQIDDAIGAETGDFIQQKCFDVAFNPTLDPNSAACEAVVRNVGIGTIGNLVGQYQNFGRIKTSGVDTQLDWTIDLQDAGIGLPGRFGVTTVFNYLISLKSANFPTNPMDEFAGTLGTVQNGLNAGGAYRWKLFNTFSYALDSVRIALQWSHLPATRASAAATNPDTTLFGAPAYDLFHLNGSISITRNATLRFGIDNLFDKAPPLINYNTAPNAANGELRGGALGAPSSTAAGQDYDLIGRRFAIGANFKF